MREAFYPAAVRGARHPLHRVGRVRERDHARQVADQADPRQRAGIDTPRAALVTARNLDTSSSAAPGWRSRSSSSRTTRARSRASTNGHGTAAGTAGQRWTPRSYASRATSRRSCKAALRAYPDGVLIEEYIDGHRRRGRLHRRRRPRQRPARRRSSSCSSRRPSARFNIYDYRLKNLEPGKVQYRCPANIPRDVAARLRAISAEAIRDARPARPRAARLPGHAGRPDLPARGQRPARRSRRTRRCSRRPRRSA